VIDGEAIDMAATESLRSGMPRPTQMFHRGRPYEAAEDRND